MTGTLLAGLLVLAWIGGVLTISLCRTAADPDTAEE
jgi:hypothetical protein